ncbi:PilN domain-containing protein [Sulfuricystis multivorans]|uniref:PilN domain-containing protein n=1 Tax=Sulfuricystis multivorans TaxID=2211108 RepID=UPI000F82BC22|nr:PilN domain-containing protein [Sulfuricystis multivorans]
MAGQINLYDPALRKKRDWLTLTNLVLGGTMMLTIVVAAGLMARSGLPQLRAQTAAGEARLAELRGQVQALGKEAEERKADARLERELASLRQLAEARGIVLQTLRQRLAADAPGFADPLRGLANLTMPGVWITGFAWDAANNVMEIRGRTTDPALLPEYIRRLEREPAMRGQAFAALNVSEGKPEPLPAGSTTAAPRLPPFHEFTLLPVKREGASVAAEGGRG